MLEALSRGMKNLPLNGRGLSSWRSFKCWDPLYIFRTVKVRNCVFSTTCISHRMTDYHGKSRLRNEL